MSVDALAYPSAGGPVDVLTCGTVSAADIEHARTVIGAVLAEFGLAADGARVRLSGAPCGRGPGLVQVNLRVHGAAARVQIPGGDISGAICAAADRLERQLRRLTRAWEPWPWPDPQRRMLAAPFDHEVTRVKTVRLHTGMPCQATAAMNALDYDVHLYTDAETGEDAVAYRAGPTGIRLARQRSMHPPSMPTTLPLTINPRKVHTLTVDHAGQRLAHGWLPFVFFTEVGTGRGNLLYRRYDGGLTLVRPAKAPA